MLPRQAADVCPESDSRRLFFVETQAGGYTSPAIGFTLSLPGNTVAASAR